jgi:hypothetical protein
MTFIREREGVTMIQGLGYFDRMLLLDTGVCAITDDQILEIFDLTGVPIEGEKVDLSLFKSVVAAAITQAVEKTSHIETG